MTSSSTPPLDEARPARMRIWDLPTRAFHWLFALAVSGVLATGFLGAMTWHFRLGYLVLALLLFRLTWGFVGGRWSRFAAFVYRPRSIVAYLRGRAHPDHLIGHTPLGALSVFAMLGLLALQVGTGLLADDEISNAGPLSHTVSGAIASLATGWHAERGKWLVLALIALHLLAVLYYVLVRRHRLVGPMISGDKTLAVPTATTARPSRDDVASRLLALLLFAACAGFALWIGSLRP